MAANQIDYYFNYSLVYFLSALYVCLIQLHGMKYKQHSLNHNHAQAEDNKEGQNALYWPSCKLWFGDEFNDSVVVYYNSKCVFSKFIKPDTTEGLKYDRSVPYIDLPLIHNNRQLKIKFINANKLISIKLYGAYKYLYITKFENCLTLYFKNNKVYYY